MSRLGLVFLRIATAALQWVAPYRVYVALRERWRRERDEQPSSGEDAFARLDYSRAEIFVWHGLRARSCAAEPITVEWIETALSPGDVLYDIGANVGAYSLIAAKAHAGRVGVFAFEPGFPTFPLLVRNVIRNECEEIIRPVNLALGAQTELGLFHYSSLQPAMAAHSFGERVNHKGAMRPVFSQRMLAVAVDDLVSRFRLEAPNHIKLDVDGLEFEILKGARQTISKPTFRSLYMESCARFDMEEVAAFLSECGLSRKRQIQYPGRTTTTDFIFART